MCGHAVQQRIEAGSAAAWACESAWTHPPLRREHPAVRRCSQPFSASAETITKCYDVAMCASPRFPADTQLRHCFRSGNPGEGGILAAHFESADVLLVARGSVAKPAFERIQLPKDWSTTTKLHLEALLVSHPVHIFLYCSKPIPGQSR